MTAPRNVGSLTIERLGLGLLLTGATAVACLMPAQNDTWWHLRAGYDMLQSGHVLLTDTFSHSITGQPWPNYEWLTEIVFACLHSLGGMPLLTAMCAASIMGGLTCTVAAMRGDAMRRTLLLAAIVAGSTATWSVRPQAFSLGLLGLTLYLVRRERWWILPPVFLVWANLHGAVALGGLVLVAACAAYAITRHPEATRVLAASAACFAATLLTPLNVRYWPEIARSIARSRVNDIAEWRPPALPPDNVVFWLTAAALAVLTVAGRRRLREAWILTFTASAWLALIVASRSMRNISPFLMTAAPALDALLGPALVRRSVPTRAAWQPTLHVALLAGAVVLVCGLVARAWTAPTERMDWDPLSLSAAAAIEQCRGPLYNRYVDGGPIIFFAPEQPVLLDSRQDPYPTALVQAQFDADRTGDYASLFQRYGINCAADRPRSPVAKALQRDGWTVRYADSHWIVLQRPLSATEENQRGAK